MERDDLHTIGACTERYRRLFADKYVVMQYNFVQFFAEHLADVSRVFDADLQSVIILALVGQMELQARIRSNFDGDGAMPASALVGAEPRINASSIAEVSGIPRETVRRKLEGLASRGWIVRDDKGWHIRTQGPDRAPVRRELAGLNHRQIERVARYLGLMHALAAEADPPEA